MHIAGASFCSLGSHGAGLERRGNAGFIESLSLSCIGITPGSAPASQAE
jgi:hypothetical protein